MTRKDIRERLRAVVRELSSIDDDDKEFLLSDDEEMQLVKARAILRQVIYNLEQEEAEDD